MKAYDFLASVIPANGRKCIMVLNPELPQNLRAKNRFFGSIEEAAKFATSRPQGLDVYFAMASYTANRRLQSNVDSLQALWVDIDCGAGKPYATKREGLEALVKFRADTGYPEMSLLVDSGGGMHGYWLLDEPVSLATWQPLADNLKTLCKQHGFEIDQASTGDSARVLRVPGTFNYKNPDTPRAVRVLKAASCRHPVASFAPKEAALPTGAIPAALQGQVSNDDLSGGIESRESGPYYAKYMVESCEVFKDSLATGGKNDEEPLWHNLLRVLVYCEDGEDYIHAIGKEHAGYGPADTERRFKYKVEHKADGGPTLCSTLENYNSAACARCVHKSPSLKTPLVLGGAPDTGVPFGFMRDDTGVHIKDDKGEWVRFLPYRVLEAEAIRDRESSELALRLVMQDARGHKYELVIPYSRLISDNRALAKTLGKFGVTLPLKSYQRFSVFGVAWLDQLAKNRTVRTPHQNMGWVNKKEFAVGDELYDDQGIPTGALHDIDHNLVDIYTPKGDIEVWRRAAQHVIDHGDVSLAIILATPFAAPLVRFTNVQAVVHSFVSELSGQGKSTAMSLAQAVYGDPVLAMFTLDDTFASVIRKLGRTKNLPAYWDELQATHVRDFVQSVVFRLSQGKEKSRLTSASSLQDSTSWETNMSVASNVSIMDQALREGGGSNAGMLRLLEFTVGPFKLQDGAQSLLTNASKDNYGHAGRVYAAYLSQHQAELEKHVSDTQAKLTEVLKAPPDTRFWVAGITTLLIGARKAQECGLLRFPMKEMMDRMVETYRAQLDMMRKEVGGLQSDEGRCSDLIHAYTSEFAAHGLVTETMQQTRGKPPQHADRVVGYPPKHMPLKWQRCIANAQGVPVLRVPKKDFRRFALERSMHAARDLDLIAHLFNATELKASLGTHTKYASVGRTSCLDIPLDHPALEGIDNGP